MTTAEISDLPAPTRTTPEMSCAEIYEEHFDFVWRNARRMGIEESVCEDLVQEVFVVAIRRFSGFEGRSSVRTWLYGILIHVVQEHRRRNRQRLIKETEASEEHARSRTHDGAADEIARKEATRLVDQIMGEMDEDKRTVFVLVDLEEMSVAEAARGLEINLNTAHARLRAARAIFAAAVKRIHAKRENDESRFWFLPARCGGDHDADS